MRILLLALKMTLLLLALSFTNNGFLARIQFLIEDHRLVTLALFCLIWACALGAILAAAFHPSFATRLAWAIPLSLAGASAYGYHRIQGSEFFIFDVLNFWSARHESQRALEFFSDAIIPTAAILLLSLAAFVMPPSLPLRPRRSIRFALGLLPLVPVILIAGVVLHREGKGSEAMPKQFSPLSLAALATYKISTGSFSQRQQVGLKPGPPLVRALVMMVDESIRADFVSLEPGNAYTPELALARQRWIDFGPAVSAANCSNISNALLRFMANRRDLVGSVINSPTVWQYAKAAGFRTVYIDAQAGFITVYGRLQNYMTPAETASIDRLYKLDRSIPTYQLDDELVRITLAELARGDRVFIYANKNGAHFPYADGSPRDEASGTPEATPGDVNQALPTSAYAKAVRWSTDRTMARLTREANWDRTTIVYTSDHGQNFRPGRLTHCSSLTNVAPHEGIVPLMVASDDDALRKRFAAVSRRSLGLGSHFAIAPTLLELMGYAPTDIARIYEDSLLTGLSQPPQFVSDDIFGLFSQQPNWHQVNPLVEYKGAYTSQAPTVPVKMPEAN